MTDDIEDSDLSEWVVRPAGLHDLDAMAELAAMTGGGFTNLPDDRDSLRSRLERSEAAFTADLEAPDNELYLFFLEHLPTGATGGTAAIFSRVGVEWPFYSYRIATLSTNARELGRLISTRILHLVNDFDGATEVGGLFLRPELRSGGLGRLLARSRYMFIALHRARFADRVLAELRGRVLPDGSSPFWDGLAGRFFGMSFQEADAFNATRGNQFIADLMPRYPVYVDLLSQPARAALGEPHDDGRGAKALLEKEGFAFHDYVDIFDGGPTMDIATDRIRTIRDSRRAIVKPGSPGAETRLVAGGRLGAFRARAVPARVQSDILFLDPAFASEGEVLHAPF